MPRIVGIAALCAAVALAGCANPPPPASPNVMALAGKDKSFEAFQADDTACRQYASAQIGNDSPGNATAAVAFGDVVLGSALGAAAGAAIGTATGTPGTGTVLGAASGLLIGGTLAVGGAQMSGDALQRRYDMSYVQCMYAKGEIVPTHYIPDGYYYFGWPYPAGTQPVTVGGHFEY
jgi:hypothetical protein